MHIVVLLCECTYIHVCIWVCFVHKYVLCVCLLVDGMYISLLISSCSFCYLCYVTICSTRPTFCLTLPTFSLTYSMIHCMVLLSLSLGVSGLFALISLLRLSHRSGNNACISLNTLTFVPCLENVVRIKWTVCRFTDSSTHGKHVDEYSYVPCVCTLMCLR